MPTIDPQLSKLSSQLIKLKRPDPITIADHVELAGYELVGIGGQRVAVALADNVVAKLAWRPSGLVDNELEWRFWLHAAADVRVLLCPALDLHDNVLYQARCLPLKLSISAIDNSAWFLRTLAEAGVTDTAVNLGIFEGRMVCYDYSVLRPERAAELLKL